MGQAKLLLPYRGMSLLRRAALHALTVSPDVVIVLGREPDLHRAELNGLAVRIVINPDYRLGMSTSVRQGVKALSADSEGVIITLADQPLVDEHVLRTLIDSHYRNPNRIVRACYGGRPGNPVLFPKRYFPELEQVSGDIGGRMVISKHARDVINVPVSEQSLDVDIDTPEDYDKLIAGEIWRQE